MLLSNTLHGISVNDDVIKWNKFSINKDEAHEGEKTKRAVADIVIVRFGFVRKKKYHKPNFIPFYIKRGNSWLD